MARRALTFGDASPSLRPMDAQRGIARRMMIGLPREGLDTAWQRDFAAYPPAGVILFRRDFRSLEDLRLLTAKLRELARPRRIFIGIDEEGGHVSQLAGLLVVPPNALTLARGAEGDDLEHVSRVTGERLRALGVDWTYAPVADVYSEPLNPVIGPRAYGTAPHEVAERLGAVLAGFRASGVASCLKHFPGHGDTAIDSHLALPSAGADRATLEARELLPFRAHLDAPAIMTAHVVFPALDPERPGTFSRAIVTDLLRGTLGYEGVVITDALEMKGATGTRPPDEAARLALEAGCDLLLFAFHDEELRRVRLALAKQLVDGALDRHGFDEARPRLARFDALHPEPTATELGRPLESLTPPDWEARLERIVERALRVEGTLAEAPSSWRIEEPEYPDGGSMRAELEALDVPLVPGPDAGAIVCVAKRTPLPPEEIDRLRRLARERTTLLLGLQNDAFLTQIPEAALRVSASDATPLTRRVVARRVVEAIRAASAARS